MDKGSAALYLPLVQALAEGKQLQFYIRGSGWQDADKPSFTEAADRYRIKPEPREIWVAFWSNDPIAHGIAYQSEAAMKAGVANFHNKPVHTAKYKETV